MQFPTSSYLTVIIIATGLLRHAGAFPTKSSAVQLQRRGQCCTKSSFTEDSLHNNDIEDDPDESVVSAAEFDWVWDNFAEPIIPETVERTVDPSVYTRPGPYKLQYSLRVLSNDGKLEEGTKGIKENAIIKGAGIRQTLDQYVTWKKRRIDDPPNQVPADMGLYYTSETGYVRDYIGRTVAQHPLKQMSVSLLAAGVRLDDEGNYDDYYRVDVRSRAPPPKQTDQQQDSGFSYKGVLQIAHNLNGVMIVSQTFSRNDHNAPDERLYSSELIWQTWVNTLAADAASSNINPQYAIRNAQYVLMHDVINQETENVMRLVHRKGADTTNPDGSACITDIPSNGEQARGAPFTAEDGNGHWKYDNALFNWMLGTPSVRPIANMLVDHNTELNNNFIIAIHTFPRRETDRAGNQRGAAVVVELGPYPTNPLGPGSSGSESERGTDEDSGDEGGDRSDAGSMGQGGVVFPVGTS